MSKITIFANGVSGGGAERVVCELSGELVERGWDVDLLTVSDDMTSFNLSNRVKRTALLRKEERGTFIYNLFVRYKALKSYIEKVDTDVYLVFLPHTTIFLLLMRKVISQPIVVAERSDPRRYPKYIKILLKMVAGRADGFVFQTQLARVWYGSSIYNKKVAIIPNAVNRNFLCETDSKIEKRNEIVSVGRLHTCKNFGLLIDAFSEIAYTYPEYSLVIYGQGGEEEYLKAKIRKLNLEQRVKLPGFSNSIRNELLTAKMFVLPSDYEGMPNALIEAMACGLPCVSTDFAGGAARMLIEDGINGLLVPVGDRLSMANAMRNVLESEVLAETLSKNAVKIREKLAPESVYEKWEQVLKDVMNR